MKCELKIITPIHIGSGEEISPVEYLIQDSKFYRIDVESLFKDNDFNKEKFLDFIENCISQKRIPYIGDFDEHLAKKYIRYQLEIKGQIKTKPQIKEFIKTSGRIYIPGSSIKGSILSALYWYVLSKLCKDPNLSEVIRACLTKNFEILSKYKDEDYIVTKWNYKYRREEFHYDQILVNLLFEFLIKDEARKEYIKRRYVSGKEQINNEIRFAPWLRVGDTNTISEKNAYLTYAEAIGAKRRIPIFYEVMAPGMKLEFEIKIQKAKIDEEEIIKISDKFYSRVLEAEKNWAKNYAIDIKDIENQRYKVRLGQGSSSLATSLLILAKDMGLEKEYLQSWKITKYNTMPKTRKVIIEDNRKHFMGWCAIIPIN